MVEVRRQDRLAAAGRPQEEATSGLVLEENEIWTQSNGGGCVEKVHFQHVVAAFWK